MRLFVAINVPESIREEIVTATAPLRQAAPSVRWTPAQSLHLTLKFLGEVRDEQVNTVQDALYIAAREARTFDLQLGGLGGFPDLRRPHVIWLGAMGGEWLPQLQSALERALATLGFTPEERPFHPHLTLGRPGRETGRDERAALERAAADLKYHATVSVQSFELMRSRSSPRGARYEPIISVALPAMVDA